MAPAFLPAEAVLPGLRGGRVPGWPSWKPYLRRMASIHDKVSSRMLPCATSRRSKPPGETEALSAPPPLLLLLAQMVVSVGCS